MKIKELEFTCKAEIEEYEEIYDGEVGILIIFQKENKNDKNCLMEIWIDDHTIDFMDQRLVKNPYQIFCDHIGYNGLHFKNHLIKHYNCTFKWGKIYVPENQLNNLIEKLESFKIIDKLIE